MGRRLRGGGGGSMRTRRETCLEERADSDDAMDMVKLEGAAVRERVLQKNCEMAHY